MTEHLDPLSRLNPMQRAAVLHTEGPLLVLAGAGSGKTTVLTERVAHIIRQGTPPWAVIAITFTNKAAGELKERLERLLGARALDVWASTFHSACVRILRREIERLGFARSFAIYDADDSARVMKQILEEQGLADSRFSPKSVLGEIGRAKDEMLTPAAYEARAGQDFRMSRVAQAYRAYQRRLREANALDFDDIILYTVTLLRDHEDVRTYYQKKFRYVLVDEYQDTNRLQNLLASLLASGTRNICAVGDDDQSIYRFRGATIENILQFEKQYPDATVIRLEQNYRSTGVILEASNRLIAHNEGRKGKTLWTENPRGELLTLYTGANDSDEADYVVRTILRGRAAGRPLTDFCALYRMNALSSRLEDTLVKNGVSYRIIGGTRFYDRMEVKDMLAYLWVVRNPQDEVRLRRIVNTPARGIGDKTVEMAVYLARRDGRPLFDILQDAGTYPELKTAARRISMFTALIDALRAQVGTGPLPEFYERVVERSGYLAPLEGKALRGDPEAQGRIENVRQLASNIAHYCAENEEGTLGGFLDEVALFTDIDNLNREDDAVTLMTMHAAKGLEFPVVFLVGAEENIFPSYLSLGDEEAVEEERRLCYVAMTRAREELYITSARERMLFGRTSGNRVSRFVEELPSHCVNVMQSPRIAPRPPYVRRADVRTAAAAPLRDAPDRAAQAPQPALQVGQIVVHRAFGRGMVLSVQPMGGDALLEIAFDGVGTKRLMYKSAGQYLQIEK